MLVGMSTPYIEWQPNFSVGIEKIDKQHQHLISLINQLAAAIANGHSRETLARVLDGLVDYARWHFLDEEKHIAEKLEPDLLHSHQAEHDQYLATVLSLQQDFETGAIDLDEQTLTFLFHWMGTHILGSDKHALL